MKLQWHGDKITLEEVRKLAENCPNCILAILRQTGLNRHYFDLKKFNYGQELKQEMSDKYPSESPLFPRL